MKIGIDGRAAKWYRGTGIGTYTYQLINNLSKYDNLNHYLTFIPEDSDLNLKDNFSIAYTKDSSNDNFWDDVKIPKILKNCDGIITVSEFSKLDISKEFNFPLNKIFVTHLAAEEIYKPINRAYCKKFIKEKYRLNDDFILYVGGYSPRKNIIGILDAFSLLKNSLKKNLKVVITGRKGISYEIYRNRAIKLGILDSVLFTDFIPLEDLPIFYNACEFLVYPSFYEGFGLPPLEAMACGVPVISSNVTSIPEVCKNSAILIDPNDIDELSYSMERVLTDSFLKLTMIERGLSTSNNYSWKNTALTTIKAYENIIRY